MNPQVLSKSEITNILKSIGFTDTEIKENIDRYIEAILVLTIEDYLVQIPENEKETILDNKDMNNPEELKIIVKNFEDHFRHNIGKYSISLNQLNLASKINSYISSQKL